MTLIISYEDFADKFIPIWGNHLKDDNDLTILITGKEGRGKSIGGLYLRKPYHEYMGLNNSIKRSIAFNTIDYIKILTKSKRYFYLQHDEAGDSLFSRDFAKEEVKDLVKLYMVIRGRNLFSTLVLPNLFMLDKYFRTFRAKGLLYFFKRTKKNGKVITFAAFYFPSQISHIIKWGKDDYDIMGTEPPAFIIAFPDAGETLKNDLEEYKEYKENKIDNSMDEMYEKYVQQIENTKQKKIDIVLTLFDVLVFKCGMQKEEANKTLTDIFGISRATLYNWKNKKGV